MKYVVHIYVPYYIFVGSTVQDDGFLFQISPLISAAFLILVESIVDIIPGRNPTPNSFWIAYQFAC